MGLLPGEAFGFSVEVSLAPVCLDFCILSPGGLFSCTYCRYTHGIDNHQVHGYDHHIDNTSFSLMCVPLIGADASSLCNFVTFTLAASIL